MIVPKYQPFWLDLFSWISEQETPETKRAAFYAVLKPLYDQLRWLLMDESVHMPTEFRASVTHMANHDSPVVNREGLSLVRREYKAANLKALRQAKEKARIINVIVYDFI